MWTALGWAGLSRGWAGLALALLVIELDLDRPIPLCCIRGSLGKLDGFRCCFVRAPPFSISFSPLSHIFPFLFPPLGFFPISSRFCRKNFFFVLLLLLFLLHLYFCCLFLCIFIFFMCVRERVWERLFLGRFFFFWFWYFLRGGKIPRGRRGGKGRENHIPYNITLCAVRCCLFFSYF